MRDRQRSLSSHVASPRIMFRGSPLTTNRVQSSSPWAGHLYSFLTLHVSLEPHFIRTLVIADAFLPLVHREMRIKEQNIQDDDGHGKSSTLKVSAMISPVASCTDSPEAQTQIDLIVSLKKREKSANTTVT